MKYIPYFKINDLEGRFVLIEGLNGSGKTTQAKLIEEGLAQSGLVARFNHEPTNSFIGKIIRQIIEKKKLDFSEREIADFLERILKNDDPSFQAAKTSIKQFLNGNIRHEETKRQFLFILDRLFDIKENIKPTLRRGGWVIQDRYDISCYLYGMANDLKFSNLARRHQMVLKENYLGPNLVFFYWVPVAVSLKRLINSGKAIDIYENARTLKKIEKAARWLFSFRFKTPHPKHPLIRKLKIKDKKMKVIIINAESSIEEVFEQTWRYLEEEIKKYKKMHS